MPTSKLVRHQRLHQKTLQLCCCRLLCGFQVRQPQLSKGAAQPVLLPPLPPTQPLLPPLLLPLGWGHHRCCCCCAGAGARGGGLERRLAARLPLQQHTAQNGTEVSQQTPLQDPSSQPNYT